MVRSGRLGTAVVAVACAALWVFTWTAQADTGTGTGRDSPGAAANRWLNRFGRLRLPDTNERNHPDVRAAFRDVVRQTSHATVRVVSGGTQVALGAVVRSDGYILTKASELGTSIECCFADGRRLKARLVSVHDETDLALLKVAAQDLATVDWSSSEVVAVGSWVATSGLDETPAAIGVVSAPLHPIPPPHPMLGVRLENTRRGPQIGSIVPRSPAAKAGLQPGDVIVRLDGKAFSDRDALIQAIGARKPGDQIELSILRDRESHSITAMLADQSRIGNPDQAELMDNLAGPLSKRRSGFPAVVQHDSVLRPRDCGGPVVGLDGKVVGINIARASRVASYAVPAPQIRPILEKMLPRSREQVAHDSNNNRVSVQP